MKMIYKKLLAILIATVLMLSSIGCMCVPVAAGALGYLLLADEPESTPVPEPAQPEETLPLPNGMTATPEIVTDDNEPVQEVPQTDRLESRFSTLKYSRPDTQKIRDDINSLTKDLSIISSGAQALLDRYEEIQHEYNHIDTQYSLAYILHSMDVTDTYYQDEYQFLEGELNEIDLPLTDVAIALIENPVTKDLFLETYGQAYIDSVYDNEKLNDEAIQDDLKKDTELQVKYDSLLSSFEVNDGGKMYTIEDITGMEINTMDDYNNYFRLIQLYNEQLNAEAGKIFLEMIPIRTRIAKTLGYGNYADYRYDAYGRDYTLNDLKEVRESAKKYLVPVYKSAYTNLYILNTTYSQAAGNTFEFSTFMNQFQAQLEKLSPEILEAFNYMLRNETYTISESPKKMETSYTTTLTDYNMPFIFTQWDKKSSSVSTIMHEFGHYAHFYRAGGGWNNGDSLDIDEIDSQGMEMIMMHNYEIFFRSYANVYRADKMIDAMYSVLAGLMEDEFQETVYKNPDMTLQQINDLYAELANEYGMNSMYYTYSGEEWAQIPHTFQSPMYYISYAVSMISALEIWEEGETDYNKAQQMYLGIQNRERFAELRETIISSGLPDPVSGQTIRHLAETISAKMDIYLR